MLTLYGLAYKILLFPSDIEENHLFTFLQVFIAWLNLDFTCFFGCLLEDLATVSIPILHLGHSWPRLSLLLAATPLASLTSSVAELFLF